MGVTMTASLSCDRCGEGYPAPITALGSEAAIRAAAQVEGWQARERKRPVICKSCVPITLAIAAAAARAAATMAGDDVAAIQAAERAAVCAELVAFADGQPKFDINGWNAIRHIAPLVVAGEWDKLGGQPVDTGAGLRKFEAQVRERVAEHCDLTQAQLRASGLPADAARADTLALVAAWCRDPAVWDTAGAAHG